MCVSVRRRDGLSTRACIYSNVYQWCDAGRLARCGCVHLSLDSGVCLAMQEVVTLLDYIFLFGGIICAS